jgi:small basic protein
MTLASVDLFPVALSLLIGVIIPHIVDLVTHSTAPPWLKSALAVSLATLTGALTTVTWQGWDDWKVYVLNIFMAFVAAFTSHTAGASEFVQRATGDFGIGKRSSAIEPAGI